MPAMPGVHAGDGQQIVTAEQFQPRVSKLLASKGGKVLEAPFALTVYLCPSCFAVQHALSKAAG
ncbi:hypothetical protein [Cohnella faecalis]|uniref:Uncharacterized protein n=1 Tax=Cohnella faecalis TaxID=2315694 RepID=A0A398CN32_9BACL|nr:hypothetical protein [Cohnella faecalis]RIE00991.1 hypothetical protein D3H35_25255 [Cohnella faecalis]